MGCGYKWKASINNKISRNSGCPACSGRVVTDTNRLSVLHYELSVEWDREKNGALTPDGVSIGSHKKVHWRCSRSECGYRWAAVVKSRVAGRGCPSCRGGPVSAVSRKWLDLLNIEKREYYIKSLKLTVDGFDLETNTVYEFLGDFWHGNPEVYDAAEINPVIKKSFGFLYEKTINRFRLLEREGYKVVYIWEKDFKITERGIL